jgi:hypothetical protein
MKCPFVMSMTRCPPDKGTLGQYYSPLSEMDTIVSHDVAYLGGTTLVSICFRMVMTQIINRVYGNSPALGYPSISIFE